VSHRGRTLASAGGIGGLVAMHDTRGTPTDRCSECGRVLPCRFVVRSVSFRGLDELVNSPWGVRRRIRRRTLFLLAAAGSDEHAYNANVLNQYTHANLSSAAVDNIASYAYDADGNLTSAWAAADMNCDGHVSAADISPFVVALNQGQAAYETAYPDCEYLNADINGDGYVTAADSDLFTSILTGGNAAVAMTYTYNGENRLIAATPTEPQSGDRRVRPVPDRVAAG
jgi:hypothetical protein